MWRGRTHRLPQGLEVQSGEGPYVVAMLPWESGLRGAAALGRGWEVG